MAIFSKISRAIGFGDTRIWLRRSKTSSFGMPIVWWFSPRNTSCAYQKSTIRDLFLSLLFSLCRLYLICKFSACSLELSLTFFNIYIYIHIDICIYIYIPFPLPWMNRRVPLREWIAAPCPVLEKWRIHRKFSQGWHFSGKSRRPQKHACAYLAHITFVHGAGFDGQVVLQEQL